MQIFSITVDHSVPYNEVRRFLTSVVEDQVVQSKGIYIPHRLQKVTDESFVNAAMDNFDQNEDTLDGKRTTHALAMVVHQRSSVPEAKALIPHTQNKTLDVTEYEEELLCYYNKSHKRPEPVPFSSAGILTADTQSNSHQGACKKDLIWGTGMAG